MAKTSRIDDAQLQALVAEGLSKAEMARRLGVPRPTLVDRMRKLGLETRTTYVAPDGTPDVHNGPLSGTQNVYYGIPNGPHDVHTSTPNSIPDVHHSIPNDLLDVMPDLHELVAWWRTRRESLQDGEQRATERVTFHVEQRWTQAIRQRADQDGTSITHVVNQAFRQFFQGRST